MSQSSISTPRILATVTPSTAKKYYFDTDVNIKADTTKHFDTAVSIQSAAQEITQYFDTAIKVKQDIDNIYDTAICIKADVAKHFDTNSQVNADITKHFDTIIKIPHDTTIRPAAGVSDPFNPTPQQENPGTVSIGIQLQEMTLSDSFTLETTDSIDILDTIEGHILDFPYRYQVAETQQQDKVLSLAGMYDVDELLYKSMVYAPGETTHTLQEHAGYIAAALGKNLNYHADNFEHNGTWIGDGQTYEAIISGLFGWSSSIPHKAFNVFMRAGDNSLNVIQRGHEINSIDITNTAHTRPLVHRELVRTMISYSSSSDDKTGHDYSRGLYVEPLPFWGTLIFGDAVCSYQSGYLRDETVNGDVSYYDYEGDGFGTAKYLSRKTTNHADGSKTVIDYDYEKTKSGVKVLGTETETHTEADGTETVRKTIHAPLGGGFYGTSVYIDGEYQGSSIGTGSPAATASRYLCNQESITLAGPNYGDNGGGDPLGRGNVLKEAVNLPTNDKTTLDSYLQELKWLNRKIKESVSMDIYNYDHVIDFTDRITFRGNDYYLVSNSVNQTPTELKQSVQLVRWH